MNLRETRQASHRFVDLRIVFHGARTERIELALDGEVSLRQTGEMAQHFELAQLRESRDIVAQQRRRNTPFNRPVLRRPVQRASARRAAFEEEFWRRDARSPTAVRWF